MSLPIQVLIPHCVAIMTRFFIQRSAAFLTLLTLSSFSSAALGQDSDLRKELQELRSQNSSLQDQVKKQAAMLESMNLRLDQLSSASSNSVQVIHSPVVPDVETHEQGVRSFFNGHVNLSGEAGLGLFYTHPGGLYPKSEFRVDEARLFIDAKVFDDIYFFTELNLTTREATTETFELGEIYVDFENPLTLFGEDHLLNLRVGRFDIPFGQEYLTRDAIDNPLILHSLADFWGVDEGVELYGSAWKLSYALAVQNGGQPLLHDYTNDKSVTVKVGYDPVKWLKLSASAMRTGALSVVGDELSELWFGGGFIRNLSPLSTTFHAEVVQGDVQFLFPRNQLKLAGGYLRSWETDTLSKNSRGSFYYSVEDVQKITTRFYGAARFSQILADKSGVPIVGTGNFGNYFFNNANLTEDIWRLSLGLGYHWNKNLLLKSEYSYEARNLTGDRSRHTHFMGGEMAVGF
ncbi:MAG: hypothetical protein JWN25_1732 [Verrucomicrobiales bacterium]|nr:hypothetical protein [Verrucomicrobiales bacterium]